ncbi:hypothetical protein FC26_GL000177 [Paucilactobacillus vaccinostercus DSM 20634]|uniref:Uncharacterized protein n=1 Tax=Paucilactobacillus vaccinostercus DSM 20634 TaxID=1423813 RepID=A0A0R2A2D5_9LACO|nr:DUF5695 domain-containing protein [Paucilactobacillus vaccinostercus]KRM60698.1 hypothetical protein FC26_GL000177 [Paucilactobacillus vaccinostercus DSM 20634]
MGRLTFEKISEELPLLKKLNYENDEIVFDFGTSTAKHKRAGNSFYQLGDVEIALRSLDNYENWSFFNTKDDQKLNELPLTLHREWSQVGSGVSFSVKIKNDTKESYEIGGLGFAMIFNQIFTDNTLDESHNNCVFVEPYIGKNAGYLQASRLNGQSPSLLVIPDKDTQFEAYRPLTDDATTKDVHFEGFYEWTVFSKAYYRTIWNSKQQWNQATSTFIKPGETLTYSLRFIAMSDAQATENTLIENGLPTVSAIPGYVIHGNETGQLYIQSASTVKSIEVTPHQAITITEREMNKEYVLHRSNNFFGPVRLTIEYQNGQKQVVNYFVTASPIKSVTKLSDFHMQYQWLDQSDLYGREHSFITFDRDTNQKVLSEERSYISGVSDEAGAGPNLLMAVKNELMPDRKQIQFLEKYVDDVLWGNLQNSDYSIKASLYYNDNHSIYSWNKTRSEETWRAYNYPHQAAIYWSLYRLARNYAGLVTAHSWNWYLRQAYKTVLAMKRFCGKSAFLQLEQYGLMVGSVHRLILESLKEEGWQEERLKFEDYMHYRYEIWSKLQYPYGSEMPWDSTGQEEVYTWCTYFGDTNKANQTVQAILAYTPLIPHWGYNGAARRYFDSFVYGKLFKITREFDHYGASLNAIPILDDYKRRHSDDLRELSIGYAASTSPLTSIDQDGFGAMAFLTDPTLMRFEPYTSDYGQAFYGYAHDAGQYAFLDDQKGWISFGGQLSQTKDSVIYQPTDAFRKRLFVHTAFSDFEIKSETMPIKQIIYHLRDQQITVIFAQSEIYPIKNRLRLSDNLVPITQNDINRGAYEFDLTEQQVVLKLK